MSGAVAAALITGALIPSPAAGTTFPVTTVADSGPGSLRQAIDDANSTSGADVIAVDPQLDGMVVEPLTPLPSLTEVATLLGPRPDGVGLLIRGTGDTTFTGLAATDPVTIEGIAVDGWGIGIDLQAGGIVRRVHAGLDLDGQLGIADQVGIRVVGATGTLLEDLVVGGAVTGVQARGPGQLRASNIGTDPTGTSARPTSTGVSADDRFLVGGPTAADANVISGNDVGVVAGSDAVVEGNTIGFTADGVTPLPNVTGVFTSRSDPAIRGNLVGANTGEGITIDRSRGTTVEANTIIANGGAGIGIEDGGYALFRANALGWSDDGLVHRPNGGLGIDLGRNGPTANDGTIAPVGPNGFTDHPTITTATFESSSARVAGSVTAVYAGETAGSHPALPIRIELYAQATCAPPGAAGEAGRLLGHVVATTDVDGVATFDVTLPVSLASTPFVTATAESGPHPTVLDHGTSEVSPCVLAQDRRPSPAPPAPPPVTEPPTEPPTDEPVEVERLEGAERIETAVVVSRDTFADGAADAVVVATATQAADAVAGTPLSVALRAPLLLTPTASLAPITLGEIRRVLPPGGTVVLLGGTTAVDDAVREELADAGFAVERIAGPNRFATAAAVADRIAGDEPVPVLLADGGGFTAATVAGAAAARIGGAVLLTAGGAMAPETAAWLDGAGADEVTAIGPEAAAAAHAVPAVTGPTPEAVAVAVAQAFFDDVPPAIGIAGAAAFPDPLAGGVHIAHLGGPLLLTAPDALPEEVATYLRDRAGELQAAFVYGGPTALSEAVADDVEQALTPASGEPAVRAHKAHSPPA